LSLPQDDGLVGCTTLRASLQELTVPELMVPGTEVAEETARYKNSVILRNLPKAKISVILRNLPKADDEESDLSFRHISRMDLQCYILVLIPKKIPRTVLSHPRVFLKSIVLTTRNGYHPGRY
jgi:hypothetical protein